MYKEIATDAAREAGKILMDNLGNIRSLELKKKNDYVSNVDIEAEDKIKEIILSSFSEHNIIAEESDIQDRKSRYTWFIDPISSTDNYIHSLPHFAISIALQEDKSFVLAVVFDPFTNELFYAEKGKGAYLNNTRITVSSITDITKAMLCVGINKKGKADMGEGVVYFTKFLSIASPLRRIGSTALEMSYIACGRIEAHINNHSDVYSIPAGKLILEEAGGIVTNFDNNDWSCDSKNVVASNGTIHGSLIEILKR